MSNSLFLSKIYKLTKFHYKNSKEYKKIVDTLYFSKFKKNLESVPFIPTNLFKQINLKSVPEKKIFKILRSSGTSSGKPSKIFLDKDNAYQQTKVLNELVSEIIGKKRLPMLIVDEKKNIEDPKQFDAKAAAILGFSIFGRDHQYLLKDKKIDYINLNKFIHKYRDEKCLIFGFTSFVFENLIEKFDRKLLEKTFSNAVLIHGGGWKKMEKKKISRNIFNEKLKKNLNINNIINYYGLIEQTGSIFFECEKCKTFTPSEYSEILIRDKNFNVLPKNKKGFIQLLSVLPKSYPGHSILTEDMGEIIENECPDCEGKKKFLVHGRAEKSEIRGCSDV